MVCCGTGHNHPVARCSGRHKLSRRKPQKHRPNSAGSALPMKEAFHTDSQSGTLGRPWTAHAPRLSWASKAGSALVAPWHQLRAVVRGAWKDHLLPPRGSPSAGPRWTSKSDSRQPGFLAARPGDLAMKRNQGRKLLEPNATAQMVPVRRCQDVLVPAGRC